MTLTRLIAIDGRLKRTSNRILFEEIQVGDSENLIYEFLTEANDKLELKLTEKELGYVFVKLNSYGNCALKNLQFNRKTVEI